MSNIKSSKRNLGKAFFAYGLAIILCLIILIWIMQLWNADLNVPFRYSDSGDNYFGSMSIKGAIDNGWFIQNKYVGAPAGLNLNDYPGSDNLQLVLVKYISLFFPRFGIALNLYFILAFFLTLLTSMFVLRHFKISYTSSILCSLLFVFIPYHFFRGEAHLFLAAYYSVPLATLIILWVAEERPIFFGESTKIENLKFNLLSWKAFSAIVISLIIASSGIYYAFFAIFFLLVIGTLVSVERKNFYNFLAAIILIALIVLGIFLNLAPSIIYSHANGPNREIAKRTVVDSEVYGLKLSQLLLPITEHRVKAFATLKNDYNSVAPNVNENDAATLGFVGSIGFLLLLSALLINSVLGFPKGHAILMKNLSVLNISAFLLGTIGGAGTLFALIITPQIRAYNRISVFIAFFAFFAVGMALDKVRSKFSDKQAFLFYIFVSLILLIGILDQTSNSFAPGYALSKKDYQNDAAFIEKIETILPKNSLVFQLPYIPFPEYPPVEKMHDYDHFRAYLHSKNLRWSYGAMKGRQGDRWLKSVVSKPLEEFLVIISKSGFKGIYIDRFGYADGAVSLEKELLELLSTKPITSTNGRFIFFSLVGYNKKAKS